MVHDKFKKKSQETIDKYKSKFDEMKIRIRNTEDSMRVLFRTIDTVNLTQKKIFTNFTEALTQIR